MISKIISGGQTGADQGALVAAVRAKIPMGGCAPKGWRTEAGSMPVLADFGMYEHASPSYAARTATNVERSDATLLFGDPTSPGSRLTATYCRAGQKPILIVVWRSGDAIPAPDSFWSWSRQCLPRAFILNVAGNRESVQPGIFLAVQQYLGQIIGAPK